MSDRDSLTSEEDLISHYLAPLAAAHDGAHGLQDDCASIAPDPGFELVLKTDPIIAGLHFFDDDSPEDIAWKALAVNLSDIAAKGARPVAYLMTLAFTQAPTRQWFERFTRALGAAQAQFGCHLIGGDTDYAPGGRFTVAITAIGTVELGRTVRRTGAKPGDRLFVSGTIGDAALGLRLRQNADAFKDGLLTMAEHAALLERYRRPMPRLALAEAVKTCASAAMDLSDGLVKDAGRLAKASGVQVRIKLETVPFSPAAKKIIANSPHTDTELITAGDDYEILAAVAPPNVPAFRQAAKESGVTICEIGEIFPGPGKVEVIDRAGAALDFVSTGYDHFARAR